MYDIRILILHTTDKTEKAKAQKTQNLRPTDFRIALAEIANSDLIAYEFQADDAIGFMLLKTTVSNHRVGQVLTEKDFLALVQEITRQGIHNPLQSDK